MERDSAPDHRMMLPSEQEYLDQIPDRYEYVGAVHRLWLLRRLIEIGVLRAGVRIGDRIAFESPPGKFIEQLVETIEIIWHAEGALLEGGVAAGAVILVGTQLTKAQIRGREPVFRVRE
jgi:hypothetical protein